MSKQWDRFDLKIKGHLKAAAGMAYVTGARLRAFDPSIAMVSKMGGSFEVPVSIGLAVLEFAVSSRVADRSSVNHEEAELDILTKIYPEYFKDDEEPTTDEAPQTPKKKRTRNWAKCALCDQVVESKHRHEYVTCGCGEISVDGGKEYHRRCAKNLSNIIELDDDGNPVKE